MPGLPRITNRKFDRIEIDGQTYISDVIILTTGVLGGWRREKGHQLRPSDLAAVIDSAPKVLVVGQGAGGLMRVPDETLDVLKSKTPAGARKELLVFTLVCSLVCQVRCERASELGLTVARVSFVDALRALAWRVVVRRRRI